MISPLDKYINDFSTPEDELLKELCRVTNLKVVSPQMMSGHIQGKLLEMLTKMLRPKRILEIGTFTGYSALCFAAGLDEAGEIDTVEVDDELLSISSCFFERSANGYKIKQYVGSALEVVPRLEQSYDLVFVDGDKREYPTYLSMLLGDEPFVKPSVHKGSYILADNILWYGKVVDKASDPHTKGIMKFNEMVASDPRLENVIVQIRDGINLIRVK